MGFLQRLLRGAVRPVRGTGQTGRRAERRRSDERSPRRDPVGASAHADGEGYDFRAYGHGIASSNSGSPATMKTRSSGESAALQALSQQRPSFTRRRPHVSTRPAGVFSLRSTNDGSRRRPPPVGPSPSSQARSTLLEVARRQRRKQRKRNQEPSSVRLRCVAHLRASVCSALPLPCFPCSTPAAKDGVAPSPPPGAESPASRPPRLRPTPLTL
ncbi:hypothetical protein PVAP13_2NG533106 [Panicum virgatum]|uniref:Uncharacterized protein n=1 Tax=Panicum virgatum TaxID=38727 RepID=A0A8T0VNR7_PANVG|nr:hypothetical protein PVAP13_2NG533106 [Panicum virgatum]